MPSVKNLNGFKEFIMSATTKPLLDRSEYQSSYYQKNKEMILARRKQWRLDNPDLCCIHAHNYRARKSSSGGVLSADIYDRLFKLQQGKCACCKIDLTKQTAHIDHIYPISSGGTNTDDNIQLLCVSCNCSKHNKDPINFMQSRGYLL